MTANVQNKAEDIYESTSESIPNKTVDMAAYGRMGVLENAVRCEIPYENEGSETYRP